MSDLINRQAAIDAVAELQGRADTKAELKGINKAWKRIKALPSAQPEIIRCKDCKHKEREEPGMVYCPMMVGSWVVDDHFCGFGERR